MRSDPVLGRAVAKPGQAAHGASTPLTAEPGSDWLWPTRASAVLLEVPFLRPRSRPGSVLADRPRLIERLGAPPRAGLQRAGGDRQRRSAGHRRDGGRRGRNRHGQRLGLLRHWEQDQRRGLCVLSLSPDGVATRATFPDCDGTPLAAVGKAGRRGVLCVGFLHPPQGPASDSRRPRQELFVRDSRGGHAVVGEFTAVESVFACTAYGRLAACSGTALAGDRNRWSVVLMDLDRGGQVFTLGSPLPVSGPLLLLGRHLFTVEA